MHVGAFRDHFHIQFTGRLQAQFSYQASESNVKCPSSRLVTAPQSTSVVAYQNLVKIKYQRYRLDTAFKNYTNKILCQFFQYRTTSQSKLTFWFNGKDLAALPTANCPYTNDSDAFFA